tara:strand:- start:199 stop:390 length:192 start_codon:yes stop_codon:yes gene_type:complete
MNYLAKIPPHFMVMKENKVLYLIQDFFPEYLIFKNFIPNFANIYKVVLMKCEESFHKMRIKVN